MAKRKALSRYRRHYPGFPKKLPCLVCGRLKKSLWPGERIHFNCKRDRSAF
jgi:hypothetical protein